MSVSVILAATVLIRCRRLSTELREFNIDRRRCWYYSDRQRQLWQLRIIIGLVNNSCGNSADLSPVHIAATELNSIELDLLCPCIHHDFLLFTENGK